MVLQGAEAHHLAVVCRLRPGQQVRLFNGDGWEYEAEIVEAGKKQVSLEIRAAAQRDQELGVRLWAAVPLPRGDRGSFLVEKLTELGVTDFVPLRTRRSVLHPSEAREEKLRRTVVEASKQCGRNVLMNVESVADWSEFYQRENLPELRILGAPGGESLSDVVREPIDAVFAVGPEGGFDDDELRQATNAGWRVVRLGRRILRVETAALAFAARWAHLDRTTAGGGTEETPPSWT